MTTYAEIEQTRSSHQVQLDAQKSQVERNKLGQFATPAGLAEDVVAYALSRLPARSKLRFLDPAIGTGSFFSALIRSVSRSRIASAQGFEVDSAFADTANRLWNDAGLRVLNQDFTKVDAPSDEEAKATLLIANPPYVRHHHLEQADKLRLQDLAHRASGSRLSGLAGLYCYFMLLCHPWMSKKGIAGWLIPTEFMDVNYGAQIKEYLLRRVRLVRIHRFDPNDVQFDDALVSSAVVWFQNEKPQGTDEVEFTYGGSHLTPHERRTFTVEELEREPKWNRLFQGVERDATDMTRVGDLFTIRRGIATGANNYFVIPEDRAKQLCLPEEHLVPILPSPRYLEADEVESDQQGMPLIEKRLVLISCALSEHEVEKRHPDLFRYYEEGRARGLHEAYLCAHRNPWYSQEVREAPPILCTYMGRGEKARPFRFILNHSRAIAANVYLLLYPKPALTRALAKDRSLLRKIWDALNAIPPDELMGEGRVYGGGLYKMEPKELANARIHGLEGLSFEHHSERVEQKRLFS